MIAERQAESYGMTATVDYLPSYDATINHKAETDFLREVARELKPRGILFQALPWGAKDPAIYRQLLDLGVESFATDYPDVVVPVMREHFHAAPASGESQPPAEKATAPASAAPAASLPPCRDCNPGMAIAAWACPAFRLLGAAAGRGKA